MDYIRIALLPIVNRKARDPRWMSLEERIRERALTENEEFPGWRDI
jgi:hypothetical protein